MDIWYYFIVFVLASIGLSHVLVDGSITEKLIKKHLRTWSNEENGYNKLVRKPSELILELLDCYQCSGWWAGLTIALMMFAAENVPSLWWLIFIVYAFIGSFISVLGAVIISFFNVAGVRDGN